LPKGTHICPPISALAAAQDRVSEKQLFERLKIPTTRWRSVESQAQLERAVHDIGLPGVLKTRSIFSPLRVWLPALPLAVSVIDGSPVSRRYCLLLLPWWW